MPEIAINDVTPRIQYTATGGQTVFPYPFAVFAQTDLKVYLTPAGNEPDDTADLMTLTTDYTVSGVGAEAGGNVTLVTGATLNDVITVERDMPIARSTDFQLAGDFLATTLNNELDRVAMMIQQIETIFERRGLSFARSVDLQGVSLLLPKPTGNKVLAMNVGATAMVWADLVALSVAATAFAQTLLDDPDAPTARTTLGVPAEADAVMDGDAAGGSLTGTYPNPTIANLAVTEGKLAANAVSIDKILDDSVSGAKLKATIGSFLTGSLATNATDSTDIAVAYANTAFVFMRGTGGTDQNFDMYAINPINYSTHVLGQGSAGSAAAFSAPSAGNIRIGAKNLSGSSQAILINYLILSE